VADLLAQLLVHARQRVFPVRQAEVGTQLPQEIGLRDELLFQQRADGRGLLDAAGLDRLDDGIFIAEASFQARLLSRWADTAILYPVNPLGPRVFRPRPAENVTTS